MNISDVQLPIHIIVFFLKPTPFISTSLPYTSFIHRKTACAVIVDAYEQGVHMGVWSKMTAYGSGAANAHNHRKGDPRTGSRGLRSESAETRILRGDTYRGVAYNQGALRVPWQCRIESALEEIGTRPWSGERERGGGSRLWAHLFQVGHREQLHTNKRRKGHVTTGKSISLQRINTLPKWLSFERGW